MSDTDIHLDYAVKLACVYLGTQSNTLSASDIGCLVRDIRHALLDKQPEPTVQKPRVPVNESVSPEYIISLIDGKPYKMLRRHLGRHGYSPDAYREAYGLPHDYPMVAPRYAERRSEIAKETGLGHRR
jgi:predicted transcriptional regulator